MKETREGSRERLSVTRPAEGVVVVPSTPPRTSFERYTPEGELGSGGMGEVLLARDALIGRQVALKVLRPALSGSPTAERRFLREARVQGQLEHPAIVPVHDLGETPDGRRYFTMKRVHGRTLAEILEDLREGDPEAERQYTTRRLLTAYVSVCLAVELAHSRGVLHRDLKPANVMLGDFGEVYVLDWGIAKVLADRDEPSGDDDDLAVAPGGPTAQGHLLGTPGYMAPEQARGDIDGLDARTDVFALGAMLFEILTLTPMREGTSAVALITAAHAPEDARASVRAPLREVAPELEALCVHATQFDAANRLGSAREVADAVERFLDGARDSELRAQLADVHASRAAALAAEALGAEGTMAVRSRALAEVGQALGLDPKHPAARRAMIDLLTSPPRETPPEARAALEASAHGVRRLAAQVGAVSYGVWVCALPLGPMMGVRSWPLFATFAAIHVFALLVFVAALLTRRPERLPTNALRLTSFLASASLYLVFGSLVLVPMVMAATMATLLLDPQRSWRWPVVVGSMLVVVVPVALELVGVLPPSYVFQGGHMTVISPMLDLPEGLTYLALLTATLATLLTLGLAVIRIRITLNEAERRLELQAWQLRRLVS